MTTKRQTADERRDAPFRTPPILLGTGVLCGLASIVAYASQGYSGGMLLLWLAALVLLGTFFLLRSRAFPRVAFGDLVAPVGLALAFAPLYLAALYEWPVQVGSDEVAVTTVARDYATREDVDFFGLSHYLSRPALLFVFWGKLADLLGGIDLYHVRLLHALFGLILIAAAYALFRQLLTRSWAIFATCVLGANHSLLMISRNAMRENTAVLAEVVALALLLWGLRRDHPFATFCGGFVAALGWYVYFPGRAAFPLWLMFLVALALFFRASLPVPRLLRLGAIATAGFVLMAAPVIIAESKLPPGVSQPNRETLLFYPEARHLQRDWVFATSDVAGIKKNISNGLTTFNNKVVDNGFIYENRGHGFVDPLTGILLWIGAGLVLARLVRRRADPWQLLPLGGFVVLWLSFAFLVNKAPNYTRLLIILPFVAYLVTEAVRFLADRTKPWVERWGPVRGAQVAAAFAVATLAAVVAWNLAIAWDFVDTGRKFGEPIGSTGRYIQEHRDLPGQKFYVAGEEGSYYTWGWPFAVNDRLRMFTANDAQVGGPIDTPALASFNGSPPFALFMNRIAWSLNERDLTAKYRHGRLRNITPDGRLVVFEVRA
jgi:hypothetical protein